jgi:hypothetical protein
MPGPILHAGAVVTCTHAGQAQALTPVARVLVSAMPVVTLATQYAVAGCALTGTSAPPCATGQWVAGALRVLAMGVPVAVQSGQSTCLPTGTPLLPVSVQPRAMAT